MVLGAFAFCYLPAFICLVITAKLGPSRVPNPLRSAVVVMIVINSALNPIIYMFRSNEFKRGFKRIFGFSSAAPSTAGNAISAPTGVTRRGLLTYSLHDDLPSFLSVPLDNATSAEPRRPRLPDLNVAGV